jgi:hypothetical protein
MPLRGAWAPADARGGSADKRREHHGGGQAHSHATVRARRSPRTHSPSDEAQAPFAVIYYTFGEPDKKTASSKKSENTQKSWFLVWSAGCQEGAARYAVCLPVRLAFHGARRLVIAVLADNSRDGSRTAKWGCGRERGCRGQKGCLFFCFAVLKELF